MIKVNNIRSLTDFQRNAKTYMKRLNKNGMPLVLTVNGKPGAVVLNPHEYQELLDRLEFLDTVSAIRESRRQFEEGKGIPLAKAKEMLRKKHGISRRTVAQGI